MTNYQQTKQTILDFILEGKSTTALSRKLGFSFDKVKRWQNGSKQFRWNEFCDLCAVTKVPLPEVLASTFGVLSHKKNGTYRIVSDLKIFLRIQSGNSLAKRMGVSASVMQRYLSATTFPDIEFVLALIDQRAEFLELFLGKFLSSKAEINPMNKSMLTLPWAAAVANAASLNAHMRLEQFSAKWIAELIGVSEVQVNQALQLMLELRLIEKRGLHYGPTLSRTIAVDRRAEKIQYAQFIRYWIRRSEQRFATVDGEPINRHKTSNKDAFRVFSASAESAQKISEVIMKAEQEIHEILQQDTNEKTDVRVLLLHHFSAQDF